MSFKSRLKSLETSKARGCRKCAGKSDVVVQLEKAGGPPLARTPDEAEKRCGACGRVLDRIIIHVR